jgi:hypothetical protein
MAETSGKSTSQSLSKDPATVMAERMEKLFEVVELHSIDKWGFKLLRAVVKETGYRTTAVIRAIEHGKKSPSHYGITPEAISDSTTLDLGMRF